MNNRLVLAYSGDIETAVTIPSLAEAHAAEVVTLTLDIGAQRDLEEIRDRALTAGAARAHVIDAREEFAQNFVLPSLRAGALRDGRDPMGGRLARALVRRKLAEVAQIERATAVLDRSHVDENLWGRESHSYVLTKSADEAPVTPAWVDITFEQGVPTSVNGVPMRMTELIESLSIIAGHHGVGRIPSPESCLEAPAAVVLHAAQMALESALLPDEIAYDKRRRAPAYAALVSEDLWFTPERESMDTFNTGVLEAVTGSVRIKLFKGTLETSEVAALDHAGATSR